MAKKSFKKPSIDTSSASEFERNLYDLNQSASSKASSSKETLSHAMQAEEQPKIIPFSTSIRQDLFLRIKQLEYWGSETEGRKNINEMVDEALETYLNNYPNASKSLPEKAYQKLIQSKKFKG